MKTPSLKTVTTVILFISVILLSPLVFPFTAFTFKVFKIFTVSYKYGYLDENFKFAISPKFDGAESFENGRAEVWIRKYSEESKDEVTCPRYIDRTGKVVEKNYCTLGGKRNWSWYPDGAMHTANRGSYTKVVDDLGLLEYWEGVTFEQAFKFCNREGLLAWSDDTPNSSDLWGFKDKNGKWVIPPRFYAVTQFRNGIAFVNVPYKSFLLEKEVGKWGAIDKKGNWVLKPTCIGLWEFSDGRALCGVETWLGMY